MLRLPSCARLLAPLAACLGCEGAIPGAPETAKTEPKPAEVAKEPDPRGATEGAAAPTTAPSAPGETTPKVEPAPPSPVVPARPEPPANYGLLQFGGPPPASDKLTLHALAGYEVVAVHREPKDDNANILGYLRLGTRTKVTAKVEGEGCPKGWHALEGGGFACASKGLLVDAKPPYMPNPPPPPRMDGPLPYDYAYVRRWNSPMWWRTPTAEEFGHAEKKRAVLEAEREGRPLPGELPALAATAASPSPAAPRGPATPPRASATPRSPTGPSHPDGLPVNPGGLVDEAPGKPAELPSVRDGDDEAGSDPTPAKASAATPKPSPSAPTPVPAAAPASPEAAVPPDPKLPLTPDKPWLEKGFFIALSGTEQAEGKTFWKTARGAFVQSSDAHRFQAHDFKGVQLASENAEPPISFPVGFAMAKPTSAYELDDKGRLRVVKKLEQRTFVDLDEEVELKGQSYYRASDGLLLRKADLRIPELRPLPEGIEPWERWIDVSLSLQLLVAYEGTEPVYVTLVSTGKKGTAEEPFETPTGRWRIQTKHISTTMAGTSASDGNYSIQDVPWTMYFEGSYALHGAFWHRGFGYVRSHGCINLGPSDAKWLFSWTTPFVPDKWHGVRSSPQVPGTTVIVRP